MVGLCFLLDGCMHACMYVRTCAMYVFMRSHGGCLPTNAIQAKAVATECDVKFLSVKGPELLNM